MYQFVSRLICELHTPALVDDVFGENLVLESFRELIAKVDILGTEQLVVDRLIVAQS